jgi:hypothetical protein
MSGASFCKRLPTRSQFNGLHEWITRRIVSPFGAVSWLNCVLPGKRNPGYCKVKVHTSTSCPSVTNCLASRSLNAASPPLYGHAVPSITIFIWSSVSSFVNDLAKVQKNLHICKQKEYFSLKFVYFTKNHYLCTQIGFLCQLSNIKQAPRVRETLKFLKLTT